MSNKYAKPEELNIVELTQITKGMERHYNNKGWDINKSLRYKELKEYLNNNWSKLINQYDPYNKQ